MADKRERPAEPTLPGAPFTHDVKVLGLSRNKPTRIDVMPTGEELARITDFLGLPGLSGLRLKGALVPVGKEDWRVEGRLPAQAEQHCVISLAPVPEKIDEPVRRSYVPSSGLEASGELNLDIDVEDDPDEFEDHISLGALLIEELVLALDPYPRAAGTELAERQFAPPGVEPLTDDALKPFAKLAALRGKLGGDEP